MMIESKEIYDHDKHGEVMVSSIMDMHSIYDTEARKGNEISTIVMFNDEWDEHGPINPVMHEGVQEFSKNIE